MSRTGGRKASTDNTASDHSSTHPDAQPRLWIPGFDRTAYGDPSVPVSTPRDRNTSSSKVAHQRESLLPETKATPQTTSKNTKHAGEDLNSQPAVSALEAAHHEHHANLPLHPEAVNEQRPNHNSTSSKQGHSTMPVRQSERAEAPEKPPSRPPATYETLKMEGETPQQLIARLQLAGTRDAHQRIRRRAKGEIVTTGLSTLDLLRKTITRSPDGKDKPLSQPSTAQARGFWDQYSNHVQHQSPNGGGPVENATVEQKKSRKTDPPDPNHLLSLFKTNQTKDAAAPPSVLQGISDPQVTSQVTKDTVAYLHSSQNSSGEKDDSTNTNTTASSQPRLQHVPDPQDGAVRNRNRWATAAEMKPPPVKPDSNAEGSAEEGSEADSTRPMRGEFGRLIRSREPAVAESNLRGWDGSMQPPPLDWEHRAQFHNNTPEYIRGFDGWLGGNSVRTMQSVLTSKQAMEHQFAAMPVEQIQDLNNHADGIRFVPRETIINSRNAVYYGQILEKGIDYGSWISPPDFHAETKLDLRDPENLKYKDETAQMFVDKRMAQLEKSLKAAKSRRLLHETSTNEQPAVQESSTQHLQVKTNVYLRPAVSADYPGMTKIYNWHLSNGVRPSELTEIREEDMENRHNMSSSARLPFIVAVERNRKNSRQKPPARRVNPNHPIQNTDPEYNGVTKDENVVGWASATDWSASDYIETTTAELEIYVAPGARQKGVGRCLMDAILDATDRGYLKKGGYDFHVAPEVRHMYTSGGGRDLHKIIFQVRSFNRPITPEQTYRIQRASTMRDANNKDSAHATRKDFSKAAQLDDREDDYSIWLKDWLEAFGFEQEAKLKRIGTKAKRFVDVHYLSRETCWQPAEHAIPDFSRGL